MAKKTTKTARTKSKAKPKAKSAGGNSNHKSERDIHDACEAACLRLYDTLDYAVAFSADVDEAPTKADLAKLKKAFAEASKAFAVIEPAIGRLTT